jgi:hypothetical protein
MRCLFFYSRKKAQVWVETVIYTLIGLSILGILLAASMPKIQEMQDESLIEQAMDSMTTINSKIYETSATKGIRSRFDLKIGKGTFIIDGENDELYWVIESEFQYSEENMPITAGIINVTTIKDDPWLVELEIPYNFDIRFDNQNIKKEYTEASTAYRFTIENEGAGISSKIILNFGEI